MVTTEGFRDAVEIGRTRRLVGGLFDVKFIRAAPLASREVRLEVPERTLSDGSVESGLDDYDFSDIVAVFRSEGVDAVAVCFMNAYVNDATEWHAAARLRELLPGVPVSASAAVVRERGEYERFSTAVLNAYLTPAMGAYLDTLTAELAQQRRRGAGQHHGLERRRDVARAGEGLRRPHVLERPGRRGERSVAGVRDGRHRPLHHLRHGRDQHRRRPRARPEPPHQPRQPDRRVRAPGAAARHPHDRGGRRQHRPGAAGRHPGGRAARAPERCRDRPATSAAAPSPPSPTPTSCSGAFRPIAR